MGAMRFRFWGVRGSIPTPGSETVRYGGNTACVEVRVGDQLLILDAGTGLRALGRELEGKPCKVDLFLSHLHWDHIQGLPYFSPLFAPRTQICFHSRYWPGDSGLKARLAAQMESPFFPAPLFAVSSTLTFEEFEPGEPWFKGGLRVMTCPLCHPNGSVGLRVEFGGRSLVYATDCEYEGDPPPEVISFFKNADVLIHDAQYSAEEYDKHRGWGHSSFEAAVRAAQLSGAKRLFFFHHDPGHNDVYLDRALVRLRANVGNNRGLFLEMAREGESYEV